MSYAERRNGELTGKWIAERTLSGKRTRFKASTKQEADRWENHVDLLGTIPAPSTGPIATYPLKTVVKRARAEKRGWKASRDPSLDQRLEDILKFFGPESALEAITADRLAEFVKMLEARKGRKGALSTKTINRYLSVVSGILTFARKVGWSTHAPAMPWQDVDEGRLHVFSPEQQEAVLALMTPMERLSFTVLRDTGMRASEFFNLASQQVDTREGVIILDGGETKNGEPEVMPVHIELARLLRVALEAGDIPTHHKFYMRLKAICAALGYDEELCVHSIRHTTGTMAAKAAVPALVQDLMRHKDYRTTQKYIHFNAADRRATMEAFTAPVRTIRVAV